MLVFQSGEHLAYAPYMGFNSSGRAFQEYSIPFTFYPRWTRIRCPLSQLLNLVMRGLLLGDRRVAAAAVGVDSHALSVSLFLYM